MAATTTTTTIHCTAAAFFTLLLFCALFTTTAVQAQQFQWINSFLESMFIPRHLGRGVGKLHGL